MTKNFELFEFKEDEEEHEFAPRFKGKLDNPNLKHTFLQKVAEGTQIPSKDINNVTCVDDDEINNDNHGDGAILYNSMDTEDNSSSKSIPEVDDVQQSSSPVSEQDPQASPNRHKPALSEAETSAAAEGDSPRNCKSDCAVVPDSYSSDEAVDMVSDADQCISESSSSTSSDIAENDGVFDGPTLDHFGDWEMEDDDTSVVLYPDFLVYQDKYCTDSVVTFTSSSIEMKGSTAYGEEEAFEIQWAVDDILKIESQWCKRIDMAMVKMAVLLKDVEQAEGRTLEIENLKFIMSDWYEKQTAVISLNVKYKALWNSMLNTDMDKSHWEAELGQTIPKYLPNFADHFEEVIYPKGDADAVSISKRDVDLLRPEVFVNDTIIDFYIKYLKNKIQPEERHRFHFFNSFFFRKLADPDKDSFSASEGRAAFQRVRKWTRKVNLFEKDFVIIPVNYNYHWSLIVMCHLGELATFEDEDVKESIRVPCILHMDSIKGSHAGLQDIVRSYLCEEWKEKRKEACEDISSRFYNLRFVSLELPQQQNSFDCGLFLLHYVELFLEQAPLNFNPFKITKSSNFLNSDWFQPAEASLKRVVIQRLIYNLLEDNSQETTTVAGNDERFSYSCQKSTFNEGCAMEFLSQKSSLSKTCFRDILSSQVDQGIEISLLPSTSSNGSQCANDPGLAFPGIFDQGLLLDTQYTAFTQTAHFNEFKSSMTPIEEVETGEHFVYSPSTEGGLPLAGMALEDSSFRCSTQHFSTDPTWDAGVSGHQEGDDNIVSSPKASNSECDYTVEEVNEKTSQVNADLCFNENPGQPSSDLTEMKIEPTEMLKENSNINHNIENLGGLASQCSDIQLNKAGRLLDLLRSELDVQNTNEKRQISSPLDVYDNTVEDVNEKTSQVNADLCFKENSCQPSSVLMEMITEPNDNANLNHNISCIENLTGLSSQCSDMQLNGDNGLLNLLGSELDVQHANKKRRITPTLDEEEGVPTSLSKDLHL